MDDLLADFVAETRDMMQAMAGELVAWERTPDDRESLDTIFRFVHTVKGNCGFFDFPRLERLSHAAETALADVRSGNRTVDVRLVDAVLAIIDRIGELTDAIEGGSDLDRGDDEHLIAALEDGAGALRDMAPLLAAETIGTSAPAPTAPQRSIRLPLDLIDRVMSDVSDLVLARNELARTLRLGAPDTGDGTLERLSAIIDSLRDGVTRMRMQRIDTLFGALPRLVRDLAADLGKEVLVDCEGGDVELDRELIEMLRDPLTHIIRNAVDHGIEPPHQRIAAGKHEEGVLKLHARQADNRIHLEITDDGRGIDGERLVAKAVEAGLCTAAEGAAYDRRERQQLIFHPGLSTAAAVTAVSGRGVGMDVVRANIERIGGAIKVCSEPGQGTRFTLALPLTLSIVPSLTVCSGGQMFAIPRGVVEEIVHAGNAALDFARMGDALLANVRGRRMGCLSLADVLGLSAAQAAENAPLVLIRLAGGDLFALAVDRVLDHEDLVIKPVAPAIMQLGLYAGATLLDSGEPVMMLDMASIARTHAMLRDHADRTATAPAADRVQGHRPRTAGLTVLVYTSLAGRRRAIRMDRVMRIERVARTDADCGGARPQIAIDGAILPLAGCETGIAPGDRPLTILRLAADNPAAGEIALAIDAIEDTALLEGPVLPPLGSGQPLLGSAMIGGALCELVDCDALFAAHRPALIGAAR
ncbi:chemotaxis protein CheA [Qipengyuania sp. YIM B01966]|uniref:chemotaxis protein CheA n=1 Tax=Qipengyuania sp. YIM B01966 TaxID=2778646 RepID=UPI0018F2D16C|nr:chemotaxis protein CheA [Qipengyuania sp. YIM B01966]